jgi:hypothetical protein
MSQTVEEHPMTTRAAIPRSVARCAILLERALLKLLDDWVRQQAARLDMTKAWGSRALKCRPLGSRTLGSRTLGSQASRPQQQRKNHRHRAHERNENDRIIRHANQPAR